MSNENWKLFEEFWKIKVISVLDCTTGTCKPFAIKSDIDSEEKDIFSEFTLFSKRNIAKLLRLLVKGNLKILHLYYREKIVTFLKEKVPEILIGAVIGAFLTIIFVTTIHGM